MAFRLEKYKLEHSVYIEVKRFIRSYPELREEYDRILSEIGKSPVNDGLPHGSSVGDPTANAAMKLMDVAVLLDVIYKTKFELPGAYQDGVFNHVVYGNRYPPYAGAATWRRWQYVYIYKVAEKLGYGGENE